MANVELKTDYAEACRRLEAWWHNDCLDRAAIAVTSPRSGSRSDPFPAPRDLQQQWLDPDYVLARFEYDAARTFWGGEAIPKLFVNLGPGAMAAFLTDKYILAPDTVWFPQAVDCLAEVTELRLLESNGYWQAVNRLTEEAVRVGKGKFRVSVTDLGGPTDVLSSLRRNVNLLFDLVERPQEVRQARDHLLGIWFEAYRRLYAVTQKGQEGGASWLADWSPSTHYPLQCDFSAMIGPKMFEESVLPELQEQARVMDNSIYHLDGPDAICHLDLVLEIPELDAIQWVPGEGNPRPVEWMDLLKKVQKKGKALWVYANAADVERLCSELQPEGLLINVGCASEEQARELIKEVERLSAKKGKA